MRSHICVIHPLEPQLGQLWPAGRENTIEHGLTGKRFVGGWWWASASSAGLVHIHLLMDTIHLNKGLSGAFRH